MHIVAVGINHRTAPVEVRERVMMLHEEIAPAVARLKENASEGAVLSTCNRTEVYVIAADAAKGVQTVKAFLAETGRLGDGVLEPYLYVHTDNEAVRHLFAVASGIDSLVLGETEILGQVRGALTIASDAGATGVPLSRLFHAALRTGRQAREETAISRHAVSVSSAGVQMARQVFGGLEHCQVLVISAGEAGSLAARSLKDAGAAHIAVANRTRSKAEELARDLGGRCLDFEDIPASLADFDVVISATTSSRYVLSRETVAAAMTHRGGRDLCLIDIAVPRNIDPDSRLVSNVRLFDIDDLEAVSLLGLQERQKSVSQVQAIVDAETVRFMQWFASLEAVPVIRALHEKAEAIRQRELQKSLARLSHLSQEDQQRIEALTKALTAKLLHDPISSLKAEGPHSGHIEAARELFRLARASEAGKEPKGSPGK